MSAEGMPHEERSFLARPLGWLTRLAVRRPGATILVSAAIALIAGVITTSGLGFRTSRLDLLNPSSGFNRLWLDYLREFAGEDDAVVVVEGSDGAAMRAAIDDLAKNIIPDSKLFHSVLHKVDLTPLGRKGLYYLSTEQLAAIERLVMQQTPVLQGDPDAWRFSAMLRRLAEQLRGAAARRDPGMLRELDGQSTQLVGMLSAIVSGQPLPADRGQGSGAGGPGLAEMMQAGIGVLNQSGSGTASDMQFSTGISSGTPPGGLPAARYLTTDDGRVGFILLRLVDTGNQFDRGSEAIDKLREIIRQTAPRHPAVEIGLTGLPIMENDEMRESATSMWWANVVSTVGVSLIVIVCFGGIRHPLLAAVAFLFALAWSFGYITLAVGHLNILSAAFGVILIGIGMDFGIHYVARYVSVRQTTTDCGQALEETARSVGPGIVTGGVTTALAFFTVAFTDFTGVVELGIISGGGVLLCIAAAVVLLPAFVFLADRKRQFRLPPEPLRVDTWLAPIFGFPRAIFMGSLTLTVVIGVGMFVLKYDHNLLNLQADGLESVELEKRILAGHHQSVWYAVSVADNRDELLRRQAMFNKLPSVQRTECIVSALPDCPEVKAPVVRRIHAALESLPMRPGAIPADAPGDVERSLALLESSLRATLPDSNAIMLAARLRGMLAQVDPVMLAGALAAAQRQLAETTLTQLQTLAAAAHPEPPGMADLPESLVQRFVGKSGRHLLKVYGRGDLWDMANLTRFVEQVKQVDPHTTGQPLQTFYASQQMQQSYILAACYALIAVTIAVLIDFGNLRDALLALAPMVLGVVQMFGLLGWFDIPLNAANMIVLPLLLGIGLDTGVHVVHDYRCQDGTYRIHSSTAIAVLITALTTIVGFGSLMVASHRGLQSLGRVMTIGATCCLFTSLVVLPALLAWLARFKTANDDGGDAPVESAPVRSSSAVIRPPHFALSGTPAADGLPLDGMEEHEGGARLRPKRRLPVEQAG